MFEPIEITLHLLEQKGACDWWKRAFAWRCPNGLKITTRQELADAIALGGFGPVANFLRIRLDLSGTNMSNVDLRGADLGNANLREADLTGANLPWVKLTGADLTGANLRGANLRGANITMTIGVKQ